MRISPLLEIIPISCMRSWSRPMNRINTLSRLQDKVRIVNKKKKRRRKKTLNSDIDLIFFLLQAKTNNVSIRKLGKKSTNQYKIFIFNTQRMSSFFFARLSRNNVSNTWFSWLICFCLLMAILSNADVSFTVWKRKAYHLMWHLNEMRCLMGKQTIFSQLNLIVCKLNWFYLITFAHEKQKKNEVNTPEQFSLRILLQLNVLHLEQVIISSLRLTHWKTSESWKKNSFPRASLFYANELQFSHTQVSTVIWHRHMTHTFKYVPSICLLTHGTPKQWYFFLFFCFYFNSDVPTFIPLFCSILNMKLFWQCFFLLSKCSI